MAMTLAERQVRLLSFSVGAVITLGALLFIQLILVRLPSPQHNACTT